MTSGVAKGANEKLLIDAREIALFAGGFFRYVGGKEMGIVVEFW